MRGKASFAGAGKRSFPKNSHRTEDENSRYSARLIFAGFNLNGANSTVA
jgi:hypothetical protein